jgi:LysM repeat protein
MVVVGDTAVAIAAQFGVSLAELQVMNPAVDLNVLQVGQELMLPESALASVPDQGGGQNGVTAVGDAQLSIGQLQRYTTPVDSIWFLGELRNDGALPVEDAMVDLTVDGAVTTIWVTTPLILPGETAPFGLLVQGGAVSADATVRGGIATNTAESRYALLSVHDVGFEALNGPVNLAGVVVNETDTAVDGIALTASFYTDDDRLSGYQILKLDGPLAVGETRPFRMTTTPPGDTPTHYTLFAIGLRATE